MNTTPLRIGFVLPLMHVGGVETFVLRACTALRDQGCNVEILLTQRQGEWYSEIARYGIPVHLVEGFNPDEFASPLRHVRRVARRLNELDYDVVLLNQDQYAQSALPFLAPGTVAIPVFHNNTDFVYKVSGANRNAWNAAIAVSPKILEVASSRNRGKKFVGIPHGVPIPTDEEWRKRKPLENSISLAYIGRLLQEQKGVLFLPKIVSECHKRGLPVHLTVVGDGPDKSRLQESFAESGVCEFVSFLGRLDSDEVYRLLLQTHMLILPSFFEGFPVVPLESQACGCVPLISFLPGSTDTNVLDGKTGYLLNVGEVEGYVSAIERLFKNPSQWKELSSAGHERAIRDFSLESMSRLYLKVFGELLERRDPGVKRGGSLFDVDWSIFDLKDFLPLHWHQYFRSKFRSRG